MLTANVPTLERATRLLLGLGLAAWAWVALPPFHLPIIATGCFIALTGLVGFCPACAIAGRRAVAHKMGGRR